MLLLAASYFCMNYLFYMFAQWLFTYLVEERGFSLLESGFLYAMPFVVGAVLAAAGGLVCDALCRRYGARVGCRAAGGVMNTGGNAAGFLAPLVGAMVDAMGWGPTLASGSLFALVGAALWLLIRLPGTR